MQAGITNYPVIPNKTSHYTCCFGRVRIVHIRTSLLISTIVTIALFAILAFPLKGFPALNGYKIIVGLSCIISTSIMCLNFQSLMHYAAVLPNSCYKPFPLHLS